MALRQLGLVNFPRLTLDDLSWNWGLAAFAVCALFLWRLWRFSLRPRLYSQEPKEYPYWIPCGDLGHLLPFLRNSEKLLSIACRNFEEVDHVFAITLAGQKVYVVKDPRSVGQVFNNTSCLSFDTFLHDIMFEFGTTESGIRAVIDVPQRDGKIGEKRKSVSQIAHDLQVQQTHGDELEKLGEHIIETFRDMLFEIDRPTMNGHIPLERRNILSAKVVSLKTWTANTFITAGQRAYFGTALAAIDPGLPTALMEMDELSWQIFYKYPKLFRPRLQALCARILSALRQYIAIPMSERQAPAWFTAKLEQEYRAAGLSDEDIATQLLFLYWGINTNISKVGFWIIVHLLKNPELAQQIREEIAPAFETSRSHDQEFIYRQCPILNAVWLEALRLSAASTALRGITKDFVLGEKVLRAGNTVLMSARQLHLRSQEFGAKADVFDHERFLKSGTLERSPAFRPFGGGPTMCPGRLLAKYMTLNFVAMVYHHFDVTLDGAQDWPRYEEAKPSIGIMSGQGDLRIKLTPRLGS